ncbi:hypothetical protein FOZ62_028542 [Perkinsus olseni]|uniref:Uncharacterized protein n=1 Tax=Perkinsus olseni TaxID=32597 RepID=A0A7J6RJ69_PEROL|nr:hypothetical protein FOZ62_028542 [Perkinsus olseni]
MMKFNLPWLLIAGRQVMVGATTGVSIGKYLFRGRFTGRGFNITADLGEADVAFTVESPNRQPYVSDRYALEGGPNTYTVNFGDGGIDSFNNDMKRNFPGIRLQASDLARLSQSSLFELKLRAPVGEFDRQALTLSEGRGRYVYNDGDGFRLTLTVSRRRLRMRVDCTTSRRRRRITRRFKADFHQHSFSVGLGSIQGIH